MESLSQQIFAKYWQAQAWVHGSQLCKGIQVPATEEVVAPVVEKKESAAPVAEPEHDETETATPLAESESKENGSKENKVHDSSDTLLTTLTQSKHLTTPLQSLFTELESFVRGMEMEKTLEEAQAEMEKQKKEKQEAAKSSKKKSSRVPDNALFVDSLAAEDGDDDSDDDDGNHNENDGEEDFDQIEDEDEDAEEGIPGAAVFESDENISGDDQDDDDDDDDESDLASDTELQRRFQLETFTDDETDGRQRGKSSSHGGPSSSSSSSSNNKDKKNKNRMGQRARRKMWEDMYGQEAKHLSVTGGNVKQGHPHSVPKNDRQGRPFAAGKIGGRGSGGSGHGHGRVGVVGKQRGDGRHKEMAGGDFDGRRLAAVGELRSSRPVPATTKEEPTNLHPSWAAKRKQQQQMILPAQGKKIKFDDADDE